MHEIGKMVVRLTAVLSAFLMLFTGIGFAAGTVSETQSAERDLYTIDMEYLSNEQALRITQRLVYINRTGKELNSILFYAAGNMFRRESALMYESGDLEKVFYKGYVPGGIDIEGVRFDGKETGWAMQGENETCMRVDCSLAPGESGVFEFDYYLLLTECGAFMGIGENDIRLSAFYFIPGQYNARYGEFDLNAMLPFTRWLHSDAADFEVTLALPENFDAASTGTEDAVSESDGRRVWSMNALNVREFAVAFGKRYRMESAVTETGVEVRSFTNIRGNSILDIALETVGICERWFGRFPVSQLDIVQSDYPLGTLNHPGLIWISDELLRSGERDRIEKQIRFCIFQQYFGFSAYTAPSSDAWLSDSVCEYLSYLMIEETEGKNSFLKAVNRDWVDALQLTIPGGLTVTSDASLFEENEYEVVVLKRGAVVMHELRNAMGREKMLAGLRRFYEMGLDGHTLTEIEFVQSLDAVSGESWEAFLTDWVFNVGDYVNQNIEWFE
ncbi:MAG: hypothetical protein IKM02_01200 [Clostridia bacterium]|nr:hypothetical protein [Clostridia bacterium]